MATLAWMRGIWISLSWHSEDGLGPVYEGAADGLEPVEFRVLGSHAQRVMLGSPDQRVMLGSYAQSV